MEIKRNGSQTSGKGPTDWFTGAVRIDPLFQAPSPARVQGASVTFEPGARTAWHTHPLGQTLVVTFGFGWAQRLDDTAAIESTIARFLAFEGPAFLEVMIDPDAGVYPMVGPGACYAEMVTGDFIASRDAAPAAPSPTVVSPTGMF